jgi:hypothetical protein
MPVLTDVQPMTTLLSSLTIGEALRHGALAVVPLFWSGAPDPC